MHRSNHLPGGSDAVGILTSSGDVHTDVPRGKPMTALRLGVRTMAAVGNSGNDDNPRTQQPPACLFLKFVVPYHSLILIFKN